jgi:hypothetical protein
VEEVIIALTGRAGVGKTSTARALCAHHGFMRIGFADPIRAMLRTLYTEMDVGFDGIDRRIAGDMKEVPDFFLGGATPRLAMQTLGTEWGRKCMSSDFWVGIWKRSVGASGATRVVVDDCRFLDEAEAVRGMGGMVFGLRREGVEPLPGNHASEDGTEPDLWMDLTGSPESTATKLLFGASLRV